MNNVTPHPAALDPAARFRLNTRWMMESLDYLGQAMKAIEAGNTTLAVAQVEKAKALFPGEERPS